MISELRRYISRYITNFTGWQTDRKIVVIESDDWGSIRMPSKKVYRECLQAGYRVDQIVYERFDSLASERDLELLLDVLYKYEDKNGNPPIITANILPANPDFEKIKASGYREYFYEPITSTFEKYPLHSNCLNLWKKGTERGIFYPQSHGREHLNVSLFMDELQKGNSDALFGFEHGMPGCIPKGSTGGNKFVESLWYKNQQDKKKKLTIILEGLELFEKLMGYHSETFIPPNYTWSPDYNKAMAEKGVQFYQGRRKMKEPLYDGAVRLRKYKLGEENKFGQRYLIRNAMFEPTMSKPNQDPVDRCLKDISVAFRMNKPAIICSHRLNYVGFIDENNRDKNLKMLEELLFKITQKWPQVEFLSSVELGKMVTTNNGRDV